MAQRKTRIGIVGARRIAEFVHMPSLRLCSSECEVIAVASRSGNRCARADYSGSVREYSGLGCGVVEEVHSRGNPEGNGAGELPRVARRSEKDLG